MNKIKKGDKVLIIKGKDKGKIGKVIRVIPREERIIIEGLNIVKKHLRPRKAGEKGKIVDVPAPLSWSNVKLICQHCQRPTRVGFTMEKEKKVRYCKKCKKVID